mmetsp:Transcript_16122/g.44634  ORF Transcript_16122/g.44634 Transcript_16122/m.44634 type:complete len:404 (+) Transcript_16122:101-1312(+)
MMKFSSNARVSLLLLLSVFSAWASGFHAVRRIGLTHSVSSQRFSRTSSGYHTTEKKNAPKEESRYPASMTDTNLQMGLIGSLRGGAIIEGATVALTNSLQGDATAMGILALTTVASTAILPLTLYRQAYCFSVGYGLSVAAMGLTLWNVFRDSLVASSGPTPFPASLLLVSSLVVYGIRLGTYLLAREVVVPSKREQIKSFDKTPRLKRIPFSLSVSLLYAFMTTPALFLCRASAKGILSDKAHQVAMVGAAIAWIGTVIEGVSDQQKFMAKRGKDGSTKFQGPSNGCYRISRHPNYFGEIVFWFGILLGGAPGLQKNIPAWIVSLLGFTAIFKIMSSATDRLETKQSEKYGGQEAYEKWKKEVPKLYPTNVLGAFLPLSVSVAAAAMLMKGIVWFAATGSTA